MTAYPTGSPDPTARDAARAGRLIGASRAALWWERAWVASWRGLSLAGVGLTLALFDVWTWFPPGPRIVLLSAFLLAIVTVLWLDWRQVFWPSREAGIRRLEDANALPHRPILSAEDSLASGQDDPVTQALWRRHLARQMSAYSKLDPAWPKPGLAARDPYALRAIVLLGLVTGFAVAGPDSWRRIAASFAAENDQTVAVAGMSLDAWITPPPYTGLAPVIMAQAKGTIPLDTSRTVSVPVGSKLTLRIDAEETPRVERTKLEDGADAGETPAAEAGTLATEFELHAPERVRVFAGSRKVGDWEIVVLPDAAPSIAFDGEMEATARLTTRIPFIAGDDYGVTAAEAHLSLAPDAMDGVDPTAEESDEGLTVALPVNKGDGKQVKSAAFEDLTAHPWAGLKVVVQLQATDASGQTSLSEEKQFTLPERVFRDPLANAIIEQRRELSRGPGAITRVAMALEAFTLAPEQFGMKAPVYLGLRSAYWRLMQSRVRKDISEVQGLLWDIALSLEDGGVTMAADEVRRLQKELQKALSENASDEEIAKLTAELKQAMQDLMQAMAESAPLETMPMVDGQTIEPQDLEKMLDRIEEMSRLGAKDAAQELLSQLQNMMEGMQGPMAEPSEREKQLAQALSDLNKIIREQEKLRDETFRDEQRERDGDPKEEGDLAKKQGDVGQKLDGLTEKQKQQGGETPGQLGEAGQAMDQAEEALKQSDLGTALAHQEDALAKLKAAQDAARQALAEEQKKNSGVRIGRGMGRRQPGMDPAGRPESNGEIDNGSVKIPTERESQRARDILNELRKRSGETSRPQNELDYLERLLRRF